MVCSNYGHVTCTHCEFPLENPLHCGDATHCEPGTCVNGAAAEDIIIFFKSCHPHAQILMQTLTVPVPFTVIQQGILYLLIFPYSLCENFPFPKKYGTSLTRHFGEFPSLVDRWESLMNIMILKVSHQWNNTCPYCRMLPGGRCCCRSTGRQRTIGQGKSEI